MPSLPESERPLAIDVALVPAAAPSRRSVAIPGTTFIVVDELCATTSIVTCLDGGASEVIVAGSLPEARRLARETGHLLAGERNALQPRGFDYGNSPSVLAAADLRGRGIILTTSNGTRALRRLRGAASVLTGSLRNASACAEVAMAGLPERIVLVCSGHFGFAVDDAITAGVLIRRILALARHDGRPTTLTDAAIACRRLAPEGMDALALLRDSASGRRLAEIGMDADTVFCAVIDASGIAPRVASWEPLLIVPADRSAG